MIQGSETLVQGLAGRESWERSPNGARRITLLRHLARIASADVALDSRSEG